MTLIADVFPKLRTPENVIKYSPKSPVSGDPRTGNMLKRPKHCCNMNDRTVIIFSDHFGDK